MNYEIERKILNNMSLTEDEVDKFLSFVCEQIRQKNRIYNPMDNNCKVCYETSLGFGRVMLIRFGCDVEILDIKKILLIPLTHYANIISFNVNGCKKTYLVDMTYSQFFGDTITLDENKEHGEKVVSTQRTFGKIKDELFVQQLRSNGFIELNESVLKQYIDAFLDLCNVKNKEQAYENMNKLLTNNKINYKLKSK